MLWLIVILLIGALSFVLFHKPQVNAMGAGWVPPETRNALPAPVNTAEEAETAPVAKQAPQMPDTFDFNDLFGGTKQGPTDHPRA
jgi:hypothetical protein